MTTETWCLSPAPITAGIYTLRDGREVLVKQAASHRFYACERVGGSWRYRPGLIHRLRAEVNS